MARKFLLEVEETSGGNQFFTHHLIKADNRQKVKYHYHRTLKDWGFHDASYGGKHSLQGPNGLFSEISEIKPLSNTEYDIMSEHLFDWPKI